MADYVTRETARNSAEMCEAVARWCWYERWHTTDRDKAAECPPERIPQPEDLGTWLPECPEAERVEIDESLGLVLAAVNDATAYMEWQPKRNTARWEWLSIDGRPFLLGGSAELVGNNGATQASIRADLEIVYDTWLSLPEELRPRDPLALLIDAWQRLAPKRGRITDKEVQIIPRSVAMVEQDAPGYYLSRFGPAAHQAPDGQLLMEFATEDERGPTLPAEVWTMGMPEAEKRGAVVPLPFRIWIPAVLHVPMAMRHGDYPIKLEGTEHEPLTLRRFLSWPYNLPRNRRTGLYEVPGPATYWTRLIDAIDLINAHETPYVRNGHLWLRRVVTVDKPGEYNRAMLDDPWGVTVWLPPGDGTGPRVPLRRLQRWWKTRGGDAAAVRALINLRFRWHVEGKRIAPVGKDGPWLYRRNPKQYDRLTDDDKDAICFPAGTGRKRRDMRLRDADIVFEKLVSEGDAVWRDGRLLPPEAG